MPQCTLVTAFYPIQSKFPKDAYLDWANYYMSIQNPIVLFTTAELEPVFQNMRQKRPIHIIVLPFEELYMWKQYNNQWKFHKTIDHEPYHTPELYAIWAQKSVFVELAIQKNPFMTEYFYWCDIGAFRTKPTDAMIQSFPMAYRLPQKKILLSSICDFLEEDQDGDFCHKDRIVGGLWGGDEYACIRWRYAYEAMLIRYFAEGKFAGKDQSVMLSTYMDDTTLAEIVQPTIFSVNPWFFAHSLLSDESVEYKRNESYTHIVGKPVVTVNIMGGLGNQLFQVASAYAYAMQNGATLRIMRTKPSDDGRRTYWDSILRRFSPYLVDILPEGLNNWHEVEATLYSDIPALTNKGLYLHGYMQSSKYFGKDTTKEAIRLLIQPSTNDIENVNKYDFLLNDKDRIVVVHARRTDYLKTQHHIDFHGPLDVEYYKRATEYICTKIKDPIFVLCSDDIMYWIENLSKIQAFQKHPFHILADVEEVVSFQLLQQFQHFIIANSSYSWWFAWLAKAKTVLAPKQWFGKIGPRQYEDIYEKDWIRL